MTAAPLRDLGAGNIMPNHHDSADGVALLPDAARSLADVRPLRDPGDNRVVLAGRDRRRQGRERTRPRALASADRAVRSDAGRDRGRARGTRRCRDRVDMVLAVDGTTRAAVEVKGFAGLGPRQPARYWEATSDIERHIVTALARLIEVELLTDLEDR